MGHEFNTTRSGCRWSKLHPGRSVDDSIILLRRHPERGGAQPLHPGGEPAKDLVLTILSLDRNLPLLKMFFDPWRFHRRMQARSDEGVPQHRNGACFSRARSTIAELPAGMPRAAKMQRSHIASPRWIDRKRTIATDSTVKPRVQRMLAEVIVQRADSMAAMVAACR